MRTWEAAIKKAFLTLGLRIMRTSPYVERNHGYRLSPAFRRHAAPSLMRPVSRPAGPDGPAPGALFEIWREIPGGHKWRHYFPFYEELLAPRLKGPIRLLEIGVYRGATLEMWRRYLPQGSVIVGLDIDPECSVFDDADVGVHVRIGDQSDPAFLAGVVRDFGPFDVIIDDGSHFAPHMIASFNALFLDGLKPDGLYVAEDTHTNYWSSPYRQGPYSFMDFAKDLVDVMHSHHADFPKVWYFTIGGDARLKSAETPRIAAEIAEIRFRDSLVAIERRPDPGLPVNEHR